MDLHHGQSACEGVHESTRLLPNFSFLEAIANAAGRLPRPHVQLPLPEPPAPL